MISNIAHEILLYYPFFWEGVLLCMVQADLELSFLITGITGVVTTPAKQIWIMNYIKKHIFVRFLKQCLPL